LVDVLKSLVNFLHNVLCRIACLILNRGQLR
jgi:hypothetical protein